jgi:hypothetical protein
MTGMVFHVRKAADALCLLMKPAITLIIARHKSFDIIKLQMRSNPCMCNCSKSMLNIFEWRKETTVSHPTPTDIIRNAAKK